MANRKVLDDLTVAEMRRLRDEEDLSNQEVAERLDITAVTVWKYLGPKGKGRKRSQPDAAKRTEPKGTERVWDAAHSLTRLEAGSRVYDVDMYRQSVLMNVPDRIGADDVHRMINELTYIEQILTKWRSEHQ